MANRNDYIIVSVESRKGGVGKTTVVLNLAKLLMKNYHVLVLDVDVTGTSINAIQNTSVWKKSTKLLTDGMDKPINLLKFFKEHYLCGENSIRFSKNPIGTEVKVYDDYVNVIGSELYARNGSLLYDPSIIFDEIHNYWLLDMIRVIAQSFTEVFDDEKKIVVILDNSPGYVGLGKSIHNLLTDLGPERGKFLSVSSLDIQDIDSCLKAVKNIHDLTHAKERGASIYFDSANQNLAALKVGSVEQETFDRLAIGDVALSYYAQKDRIVADMDVYQAIVFNKVPLTVKNGRLIYQYANKDNEDLWSVFVGLCGDNPNSCMIPYDESIHYQFFRNSLTLPNPVEDAKHEHLEKQLDSLMGRVEKLRSYFRQGEWRRIAYQLNTLNRDLGRVPESLQGLGLFEQASHINPEWYPVCIFRKLFRQLQDMGLISYNRDFYFPFFLAQGFAFERYLHLNFMSHYPEISAAVRSIFVVLDSFLKQNEDSLNKVISYAEDILKRCFLTDNLMAAEGYKGKHMMEYISKLSGDAYKPEHIFQLTFLETLVRVIELPEDIMIICNSIRLLTDKYRDNELETDANVSWILDERIIKKEISFVEAKEMIHKEISESDYMAVVRQVIKPIILRWKL